MKNTKQFFSACLLVLATVALFTACNNNHEEPFRQVVVETASVTDILDTTAVCWGRLIDKGSEEIAEYGVEVNGPDYYEKKFPATITQADSFGVKLTGLRAGGEYRYRVYAQSATSYPVYGTSKRFETLTPPSFFYIIVESVADLSATVIFPLHRYVYTRLDLENMNDWGVFYNTGDDVTPKGTKISANGDTSVTITGLIPETIYTIIPYAVDKKNLIGYGYTQRITTDKRRPTVQLNRITDIMGVEATATFEITDNGGSEISECGVRYSTDQKSWATKKAVYAAGQISFVFAGMTPGTTYYVQAYARNAGGGTGYSLAEKITTPEGGIASLPKPVITADVAYKIKMEGRVSDKNYLPVTEYGFCWSTEQGAATVGEQNSVKVTGGTADAFENVNYRLKPGTTYYVKSYAVNMRGTGYSDELVYRTPDVQYGTLTDSCDGLQYRTVVIGSQVWMADDLAAIVANYSTTEGYFSRVYTIAHGAYSTSTACPPGWHIPSVEEVETLIQEIGGKHNSTTLTTLGTNSTGFSSKPVTNRGSGSIYTDYWTSYLNKLFVDGIYVYDCKTFSISHYSVYVLFRSFEARSDYYPIRCVKD